MTFSPKDTFAKGPSAQPWTDIVSSTLFREAAGVAMLEMHAKAGVTDNSTEAAADAWRINGARLFLSTLMNLTTPPEERPKRLTNDNLIHT